MAKTINVESYIASAPKNAQAKLRQMRACIKSVAKRAKEEIKWSMPAFSYKRILVMYAAFKNHIGLYPTPRAMRTFSKELKKYKTGKGSIQFPLDKPLPLPLIRKIVKLRVKESLEKDKRWM
jgi:uncharacterized protein YdhG (YjbR/CyaY superfamily)